MPTIAFHHAPWRATTPDEHGWGIARALDHPEKVAHLVAAVVLRLVERLVSLVEQRVQVAHSTGQSGDADRYSEMHR